MPILGASGSATLLIAATLNGLMETKRRTTFHFPRDPLLVEIERRCLFPDCAARNLIGLTKSEAIEYRGFDCRQCERWNDDRLRQREIPDALARPDRKYAIITDLISGTLYLS